MWPAINFFMWKWPVALKRLGRPVLGVPVYAHSVVTLLANSRGEVPFVLCSPWQVFSLTEYTVLEIFSPFPENRVCREVFHCIEHIFYHSGFLNNLRLPWKTEMPEIFHCIEYTFTFRSFEQLSLALKNSVCPEIFHCFEHLFHHSGFLSNLRLPWKQSLPWIHCIEYTFFIVQDYWASCACPEKQLPWNIPLHWNLFIVQDFSPTRACPENRFCAEIFQDRGGGGPPEPRASHAYGRY